MTFLPSSSLLPAISGLIFPSFTSPSSVRFRVVVLGSLVCVAITLLSRVTHSWNSVGSSIWQNINVTSPCPFALHLTANLWPKRRTPFIPLPTAQPRVRPKVPTLKANRQTLLQTFPSVAPDNTRNYAHSTLIRRHLIRNRVKSTKLSDSHSFMTVELLLSKSSFHLLPNLRSRLRQFAVRLFTKASVFSQPH